MNDKENPDFSEDMLPTVKSFVHGDIELPSRKIKENRVRTVWRLDIPGKKPLLIKHYRYLKLFDRIRYSLIPDKSKKEATNLKRVRGAGIPVPKAFASEKLEGHQALFIGEFITGTTPWPERPSHILIAKLAKAIRDMHNIKFLHRDLHIGNVLVSGDDLYLIDFHRGIFLPFIPKSQEIKMLAMIVASFRALGQHDVIDLFLSSYAEKEDPSLYKKVKKSSDNYISKRKKSRSKRCTLNSTSFTVERKGKRKIYKRREISNEKLNNLLDAKGENLSQNKKGSVILFEYDNKLWCRKLFRYSILRGYFARIIPSRLWQAWCVENALVVHQIPVPLPYAYVRNTRSGFLKEEILITEGLKGFSALPQLFKALEKDYKSSFPQAVKEIIKDLSLYIERFHSTRFWQHDMAPKNIMARKNKNGWEFRLIDLDNVKCHGLNRRRLMRNLVQIGNMPGASIRWLDMARFLKTYSNGELWEKCTVKIMKRNLLKEMLKRIVRENNFFQSM